MGTAAEWKRRGEEAAIAEAEPLTLPSGMTIQARRPGPGFFAQFEKIPMGLAALATGEAGTGVAKMRDEDVLDVMVFMREVLRFTVVSPRIALTPGPDTIMPGEIPEADTQFLLRWAVRGEEAARFETFRTGRADAHDRSDGEDVRATAEHAARD